MFKKLRNYYWLVTSLAWKDLKVRYKSTYLGFIWALLTPLLLAGVLTVIFTKVIPMGLENFAGFVLCALFPWNFFQATISSGTTSIVDNGHLIKKVFFHREIIPFSITLANLFTFLFSLVVFLICLFLFRVELHFTLLFLPALILIQVCFTLGVLLLFSGLHAYYRDVKYLVEILLLIWFYMTPVFYPVSLIEERFPNLITLYLCNPMASLVTLYRQVLLYGQQPQMDLLLISFIISMFTLFLGIAVFRKYEPLFADVV